jgi:hypothetical protein
LKACIYDLNNDITVCDPDNEAVFGSVAMYDGFQDSQALILCNILLVLGLSYQPLARIVYEKCWS